MPYGDGTGPEGYRRGSRFGHGLLGWGSHLWSHSPGARDYGYYANQEGWAFGHGRMGRGGRGRRGGYGYSGGRGRGRGQGWRQGYGHGPARWMGFGRRFGGVAPAPRTDVMEHNSSGGPSKADEALVNEIYDALPKLNCRACGYPSCHDCAGAIAEGAAPYDACRVLRPEQKERIKEILEKRR